MIINNDNYKEIFGTGIHFIEVAGDQCAGCAAMNPIVAEIAKRNKEVTHHYVNVTHTNYKFIEDYGVSKVPTLLLVNNGELIAQVSGYQPPEILELWFEDKLEEIKNKK